MVDFEYWLKVVGISIGIDIFFLDFINISLVRIDINFTRLYTTVVRYRGFIADPAIEIYRGEDKKLNKATSSIRYQTQENLTDKVLWWLYNTA